jgi:tRNA-2-methylthio-N6-dimethylallyladenosine synthase
MGRRYDRDQYLDCVARLRAAVPEIAITTDVIVGFPGETDEDFAATISLLSEVRFDDAFTFKYSTRDGTAALRLPNHVPEGVKGQRLELTIETVRKIAAEKNAALVGRVDEVLAERVARRGDLLQTRTRTHRVVLVEGAESWIGSYFDVRLTSTTGATFTGVRV